MNKQDLLNSVADHSGIRFTSDWTKVGEINELAVVAIRSIEKISCLAKFPAAIRAYRLLFRNGITADMILFSRERQILIHQIRRVLISIS